MLHAWLYVVVLLLEAIAASSYICGAP